MAIRVQIELRDVEGEQANKRGPRFDRGLSLLLNITATADEYTVSFVELGATITIDR